MKKQRFTEEQIIAVLKEQEAGIKTADLSKCLQPLRLGDFHAAVFGFPIIKRCL
jgi:hypothetical protein